MSFNLNKLVQPECGAPNPLVAAAQQISSINRASGLAPMTSLSRMRGQQNAVASGSSLTSRQHQQQQQPLLNFTKEFAQRHPQPIENIFATAAAATSTTSKVNCENLLNQQSTLSNVTQLPSSSSSTTMNHHLSQQNQALHPMQYFSQEYINLLKQQYQQQQQQQGIAVNASDQLETKYRNDMISQTSGSSGQQQLKADKLDDVEFWQTLSQTYMGPPTFNNIAKLRAEKEAAGKEESSSNIDDNEQIEDVTKLSEEEKEERQQQLQQLMDDEQTEQWLKELNLSSDEQQQQQQQLGDNKQQLEQDQYAFDERNPLKDQFEDPFAEGMKRLELGDIPSAALLFEAAILKEPENSLAWQYLGTTQAQNEKDRLAISALKQCLKLEPENQPAKLAIAASLVNESRHREACSHLLEWLIQNSNYNKQIQANLNEYNQLDTTLNRTEGQFISGLPSGHYDYVRERFVQAARLKPNDVDPEVQSSLGVIFNMRAEYDKAVDCFKAALSVRQDDSLLWNRLGATLANGNKSDEAVVAYRRALEIAPGFLRSRYNLAISLIHLNLYDESAKQLVQILNMQAAGESTKSSLLSSSSSTSSSSSSIINPTTPTTIRSRSITSSSIWNTLRTVTTLMNRPELYAMIDGRDLAKCNQIIMGPSSSSSSSSSDKTSATAAADT